MRSKTAVTEAVVFAVAFAANGELSHFTWWAVLSLIASDIAVFFHIDSDRGHVLAATVSVCVSITVMFFSTQECNVFRNALAAYGPVTYTLGNFALHYWPSLRLVPRAVGVARSWRYGDAACLITLYTLLHQPVHVYKCPAVLPHEAFVIGSGVGSVLIEAAMSCF